MKFDKLVNEILNEGFKKDLKSKTSIENEYGFAADSVGSPEKEIIKGLKMIKQSVKTTGSNGGYKAGGKIVNPALYKQALKFFKQLGGTKGAILNDLEDTDSGLCEAIWMHISNDNFGYKIFQDITDAFEEGRSKRIAKDPTLGGTISYDDPYMDEEGNPLED
jgi:hypothetical protein